MTEQKFHPGDIVRIRPFDQIDREDIGRLTWTPNSCYGIPSGDIAKARRNYGELIIHSAEMYKDSWVYHLRTPDDGFVVGYSWAQGMLEPAEQEFIEIPEADAFLAEILA